MGGTIIARGVIARGVSVVIGAAGFAGVALRGVTAGFAGFAGVTVACLPSGNKYCLLTQPPTPFE